MAILLETYIAKNGIASRAQRAVRKIAVDTADKANKECKICNKQNQTYVARETCMLLVIVESIAKLIDIKNALMSLLVADFLLALNVGG